MARNEAQSMASELTAARQEMRKTSCKLDVVHHQMGALQKQFTGMQDQLSRMETLLQRIVNSQRRTTEPALGRCTLEGNFKYPSTGFSVVATGWEQDQWPNDSLRRVEWENPKVPATLDGYIKLLVPVIEEYFSTGDVELAAFQLRSLGSDQFHHYFVKKLISMAMDRHDKEREMASVLLSALFADLLSSSKLSEGFMMLLESTEDLAVDIPDAIDVLAVFVVRAVVDEILPPVFLTRARALLPESFKGVEVLRVAEKSYLSAPHHAELVERKWGGSTYFTVEEAKKRIQNILREHIESVDELSLDIPSAITLFDKLVSIAISEEWLDTSFSKSTIPDGTIVGREDKKRSQVVRIWDPGSGSKSMKWGDPVMLNPEFVMCDTTLHLSVSSHHWGRIETSGNMLSFNVVTEEAFQVPLVDVSQIQMQGKIDVVLEFHFDDTIGANEKGSLMDLSFHVRTSNTQFVGDEHLPPAQILWRMILGKVDVGPSEVAGVEPVVEISIPVAVRSETFGASHVVTSSNDESKDMPLEEVSAATGFPEDGHSNSEIKLPQNTPQAAFVDSRKKESSIKPTNFVEKGSYTKDLDEVLVCKFQASALNISACNSTINEEPVVPSKEVHKSQDADVSKDCFQTSHNRNSADNNNSQAAATVVLEPKNSRTSLCVEVEQSKAKASGTDNIKSSKFVPSILTVGSLSSIRGGHSVTPNPSKRGDELSERNVKPSEGAGNTGVAVMLFEPRYKHKVIRIEMESGVKFEHISAPQPTDVAQSAGTEAAEAIASLSSQYFDLLVKLENDQEHLCRNIQRNVYHNLFNFISGKHLKTLNLEMGTIDMGMRCLNLQKPLLKSGTLGARCNTQVVISHLTENYGTSRDPPKKQAPMCTVYSFPHNIDHCLTWARSEFECLLEKTPNEVNSFKSNHAQYAAAMRKASDAQSRELLQRVCECLDKERCERFEDCTTWARLKFEDYFANRGKLLAFTFHEDAATSTGVLFWSAPNVSLTRCNFQLLIHLAFTSY